jgi:phosphoglycerate dehydrogenase-like enzyme
VRDRAWQGDSLSVFSQESIGDDAVLRQLFSHKRVIVASHLGTSTVEAQMRAASEVARNIISALRGDILSGVATRTFLLTKPA